MESKIPDLCCHCNLSKNEHEDFDHDYFSFIGWLKEKSKCSICNSLVNEHDFHSKRDERGNEILGEDGYPIFEWFKDDHIYQNKNGNFYANEWPYVLELSEFGGTHKKKWIILNRVVLKLDGKINQRLYVKIPFLDYNNRPSIHSDSIGNLPPGLKYAGELARDCMDKNYIYHVNGIPTQAGQWEDQIGFYLSNYDLNLLPIFNFRGIRELNEHTGDILCELLTVKYTIRPEI